MNKELGNSRLIAIASITICLSMFADLSAQQPLGTLPSQTNPQLVVPSGVAATPVQDDNAVIRPTGDRLPTPSFSEMLPSQIEEDEEDRIMLNTRFAGWHGASLGVNGIGANGKLRGNWIMVNRNGRFDGEVTPSEGADLKGLKVFLLHMGRMVKQTRIDSDGHFSFNNVRQGGYALVGWGDNAFFAFGLNILSDNPSVRDAVKTSVKVTAFQNKTTINTDWVKHYSPNVYFRVFGNYTTGEAETDPPEFFGIEGLNETPPPSVAATSIASQSVSTLEDGRLVGRVHQFNSIHGRPVDVRSTRVLLLEGDNVVASTTTDNFGVFEFLQVPDGSYGLLAAGVDGVGLIAINVKSQDFVTGDQAEPASQDSNFVDFTMVSSETIGWLNHYASELAYQRLLNAPRRSNFNPTNYCPQCGNQPGGCGACQGLANYYFCRSRNVTFDQWARKCNCAKPKPQPYGANLNGTNPNGPAPYGSDPYGIAPNGMAPNGGMPYAAPVEAIQPPIMQPIPAVR